MVCKEQPLGCFQCEHDGKTFPCDMCMQVHYKTVYFKFYTPKPFSTVYDSEEEEIVDEEDIV
jgi:hypothetical protein